MNEFGGSHGAEAAEHMNGMEVRKGRRLSEEPAMVWLEQREWSKGRRGYFLKSLAEHAKKLGFY